MSLIRESRLTFKLALPLMIGQLSQMLLGVADTLMIGRLGVRELAVLTFSNSLFYVVFIFGVGLITPISVFTANARGALDGAAGRASCRNGVYVATVLGVLLFLATLVVSWHLDRFGQPAEVVERTPVYFRILMASMVPALMSLALKNHADALNRPWPPFWIFLAGVVLNVFLNWVMIFGNLGFPPMGLEGAGWATLISRVAILLAMVVWLYRGKGLREWVPYRWFRMPDMVAMKRFMGIGFPASMQMLAEVGAFSAAGLMMGFFGEKAMASHQIALMCAATAFMIPLGLSMALTVRVSEAAGAGEVSNLRPIVVSGWWLAVLWSLIGVMVFLFGGDWLAGLYVDDAAVIRLAAAMMVVVGIFQLFDSLQICSVAMLRGLHDARIPAVMGFISYWLVGLPVAYLLSLKMGMGAIGVWWGLAAGLAVACGTLAPRLWIKVRG